MTTEEFFNSGKCLARHHNGHIQILTVGIVGSENRQRLAVKEALTAAAVAVHKVDCMTEEAVNHAINSVQPISNNITVSPS